MEEPEEMSFHHLLDDQHKYIQSLQRELRNAARQNAQLKEEKKRGRPKSEATLLAEAMMNEYELIIGANKARFIKAKNGAIYPLEGVSATEVGFITELSNWYKACKGELLDPEVGKKATETFANHMQDKAVRKIMPVAYRSALVREDNEYVWYYDRCERDHPKRFIRVTAKDVTYQSSIESVLFIAPENAGVAEMPIEGYSIEELEPLETLTPEQWRGLVFWCTYTLLTEGTRVHLVINGPTRSGKTTVVDWIHAAIDPKHGERGEDELARSSEDLLIWASNNFIASIENLEDMPVNLSPTFARMVNLARVPKRTPYTASGLTIIEAKATCTFTSIESVIRRTDVLKRSWIYRLSPRADNSSTSPITLRERFKAQQPAALGAFIRVVQGALRNIDKVAVTDLPDKADFARWSIAAGIELGYTPMDVLKLIEYFSYGGDASHELSGFPWLVQQLVDSPTNGSGEYRVSWDQMLNDLRALAAAFESHVKLPTTQEWLSRMLHEVRHELYDHGIVVHPSEHTRYRNIVRIERLWTPEGHDARTLANFAEWRRRANGED